VGYTSGLGYIALAAMIFGRWRPSGAVVASIIFGLSVYLSYELVTYQVPVSLYVLQMFPYLITIAVVAGLIGRVRPPAADGKPYSYQYSGGNDHDQDNAQGHPHGHIKHVVGHGTATIEVQLQCDPRYVFNQTSFGGDNQGQLEWQGIDSRKRTIKNQCSRATNANYKIKIMDTTAGTTLDCDPAIRNVPS